MYLTNFEIGKNCGESIRQSLCPSIKWTVSFSCYHKSCHTTTMVTVTCSGLIAHVIKA